ncbi:MAG: cob(I)yrinic acid a,c-diamide adenosyltransferase [Marinilabiliales bacterium]|nr:MAG: cob(I)yrinic acid a,c-diamide adenosyltransferase [Marinilabiliales bacterium]
MQNKGLVHIYTGNGKGKTTSAFGLALRASGSGKKVFIAQFVKGMHYSELDSIKKHENIELKQFGRDCFIEKAPVFEDIKAAQEGFDYISEILVKDDYDMIILDEIFIALFYKLIRSEDLKRIILDKHVKIELILTGRYAPEEFYDIADLVTEMKEIKHYYNTGIEARPGIEF